MSSECARAAQRKLGSHASGCVGGDGSYPGHVAPAMRCALTSSSSSSSRCTRSSGHALVVRKRRRIDSSLEELVRLGAVSRAMATFLENCMTARANVLVCGPQRSSVTAFLSALAMSAGQGERIVAVQDVEECTVPHAYVLSVGLADLGARGEASVRAAARLCPERLVVSPLAGALAGVDGIDGDALDPVQRHRVVPAAELRLVGKDVEPQGARAAGHDAGVAKGALKLFRDGVFDGGRDVETRARIRVG